MLYTKQIIDADFFNSLQIDSIEKIDYSDYRVNIEKTLESAVYMDFPVGSAPYKLYSYISDSFDGILIIDIGTHRGLSAISFAHNKNNTVISFEVNPWGSYDIHSNLTNLQFITGNVLKGKYDDVLLRSSLILCDIDPHDGIREFKFHEQLQNIKYVGAVIYDDIQLNPGMTTFWNNINNTKLDISMYGHSTGTGIVFYE